MFTHHRLSRGAVVTFPQCPVSSTATMAPATYTSSPVAATSATVRRRDLFLKVLEQARRRYRFVVLGYVVMPEHFHLLLSEPQRGTPSTVMQAVKLGFNPAPSRRVETAAENRPGRTLGAGPAPSLAGPLPRFQCVDGTQTHRKAALHAPQPGEARVGARTGAVALEQFSILLLWRNGTGADQRLRSLADEGASKGGVRRWFVPSAQTRVSKTARRRAPGQLVRFQHTASPNNWD